MRLKDEKTMLEASNRGKRSRPRQIGKFFPRKPNLRGKSESAGKTRGRKKDAQDEERNYHNHLELMAFGTK